MTSRAIAALLISALPARAALAVFGPMPYRVRSDSPFYAGIGQGDILLEDFEDRLVNTPGVTISGGEACGPCQGVDEDDGIIDGESRTTRWGGAPGWLPDYGEPWRFEIKFEEQPGLGLPYYVGLALLGFNPLSNFDYFELFRAYDADGNDLTEGGIRIDTPKAPIGTPWYSTVGDRFIGIHSEVGIERIVLGYSAGFDHLQYGWAIPEPETAALAGLTATLFLKRKRRMPPAP